MFTALRPCLAERSLTSCHLHCPSVFPYNVIWTPAHVNTLHIRNVGKIEPAWAGSSLVENSRREYVVLRRQPHLYRITVPRAHRHIACTDFPEFVHEVGDLHGKHDETGGGGQPETPLHATSAIIARKTSWPRAKGSATRVFMHPVPLCRYHSPAWICNSIRGLSCESRP